VIFVSCRASDLASLASVGHREKGNLRLLLCEGISSVRREFLQTLFRTVVAPGGGIRLLEPEELAEVLGSEERDDLFVGGAVNPEERVIVLYRGNFDRLAVPLSWFERDSTEVADFDEFEVTDHGQTIRFGDFEVASDAILYDFDPDYRARAKKRQVELDDSLGGALRRLRTLRGVARSRFASVSAKEIARIERGEVERPRRETLEAIARRLGVEPEEIETY
jgi:DNA-binding Xre family transcriptional regulator